MFASASRPSLLSAEAPRRIGRFVASQWQRPGDRSPSAAALTFPPAFSFADLRVTLSPPGLCWGSVLGLSFVLVLFAFVFCFVGFLFAAVAVFCFACLVCCLLAVAVLCVSFRCCCLCFFVPCTADGV